MRKMLMVLCFSIVILPVPRLYAHPPEKVVLSYDQGARSLKVEAVHPVADPGKHFVDRIEILLNDERVIEKEPPRQDARMMSEVFPLTDVKSGDIVKATAFCNKGGERSGQIEIALAEKSS